MEILRLTLLVFSVILIILNKGQSKKIHLPARKTHHGFGFDYVKNGIMGPQNWGLFWPDCKGDRQSPINVVTNDALYYPFKLNYLIEGCNFKGMFKNNGHSPTFTLNDKGTQISGIPRFTTDIFELYNFHFHFGHSENDGSEHSVDGKKYAGEMHMVHYNTKYDTFSKAVNKDDGLVVLGIFLEDLNQKFNAFDKFINQYGHKLKSIQGHVKTKFNPFTLLPKKDDSYFYKGSLTTPGCFQSVNWVVFKHPVHISNKTLKTLREMETIYNHEQISKAGNCRPKQPSNGRVVLRNCK
ncbi:carbonic anhydrase 7-like [Mytilus trossulus]|uniref:carbonic anhydrase 7-like n=1 Tax=Mytilus trossulus TaxID=6551 RepID=UPI0030046FC4